MLKTQEFEIDEIKFKIKELSMDSALSLSKIEDREEIARKTIEMSVIEPKLTKELLAELPAKTGIKLIMKINELNGFGEGFPAVPEVLPKRTSGK